MARCTCFTAGDRFAAGQSAIKRQFWRHKTAGHLLQFAAAGPIFLQGLFLLF
jgi:hypothetical protein